VIFNKDFVWIHFPKAAGSKIEVLFQNHYCSDPSIHQDLVGIKKNPLISWHDSIDDRRKRDPSFTLGRRCLIVCTRRLPAWLKSRLLFEMQRSPGLKHDPSLLLQGKFLERTGRINHADKYISKWISPDIRSSHSSISYLRVEEFANDFREIFGQYLDISKISKHELEQRENTSFISKIQYDIDQIIFDNLDAIYDACPLWSDLEKNVYGGILQ
jgi:hypothetical protein